MRLLADENFSFEAVEELRRNGHDVYWVRTEAPGIDDTEVMRIARLQGRTLITFDKDFGELVFRFRLRVPNGVVLFRISPSSPSHIASVAVAVFRVQLNWDGHFSVVERDRIRMTPFPADLG